MEPIDNSGRRKQRDRRSGPRRADEGASKPDRRASAAKSDGRAVVPAGPATTHDGGSANSGASANKTTGSAAFAAQLLGQPGVKRGLKGGPPVLEGARAAYLDSEYLGKGERRAPKGVITKTEI